MGGQSNDATNPMKNYIIPYFLNTLV